MYLFIFNSYKKLFLLFSVQYINDAKRYYLKIKKIKKRMSLKNIFHIKKNMLVVHAQCGSKNVKINKKIFTCR